MNSEINLMAIYIADIMGAVLMFIMLCGNSWNLRNDSFESKCTRYMILITLLACMIDPIVFTLDGKPGSFSCLAVYSGNMYLIGAAAFIGLMWVYVIIRHTESKIHMPQRVFYVTLCTIGVVTLVLNLFMPIIFDINSQNVYTRESLYWIFLVIEFSLIFDGFVVYILAKRKGGVLTFFPVWQFMIPIFSGLLIQTLNYGVSTGWPFMAIAIAGLLNSFQNEKVYMDPLTGLYNRVYLDDLKIKIMKRKTGNLTALMLDMNGFKSINDNYGHDSGDQALIEMANILRDSVGTIGKVIRYAGDEFVILINTQQQEIIEDCISTIQESVTKRNNQSVKPYQLSFAIGYCSFDLKKQTIDDMLNEVDRRMYENKEAYYASLPTV